MVNNMDHGLPKFSLLGYDDWKIMMEAHLYALHDCMWMVLEDGPLKIQMENPERNPTNPDVVKYIPKPKEKWDDRDCKKHNLENIAKAAILKTLDPITFSKIKHVKTAMEIWQGLGKLCEGSEDLRKQKIEVLLEKFKGFKILPEESFDMMDERFHKILNDLASLNHVLSLKEKNVRLLRSLPAEWYTKATAMEEGRNLENYIVRGLIDELRTYEHELKKKKEEQVTPFPTALMTTPRVPASEETCPRKCDTPSSSQPPSSKTENYEEELAMMIKQFRNDKDEEINEGDRMKPTEFIPFGSLPLKNSQRNPDSAEPTGNHGQPSNIPDHSHGDHSGNGDQEPIHPETPTNSVLQPEAELDQPVNPNQHNLHWLRDHPPQQVIGDIQSDVRTKSAQQNLEAMLACFISQVEPKSIVEALADSDWINAMQEELNQFTKNDKLEAKCSSPAFYQTYLEMIAAQELSEFIHLKIGFMYEDKVLEFYKNGKISTIQSKKNSQRTIQVIKSTVGGTKVKISQKKLMKKLHLPNSRIEIGRLPSKNLDWKTIGISGQIPSGPAKKADLKNDYKLVLELVITYLECGSGGHADDITQERAFIINALITRTKVNWAKHFFNCVSKHLEKPKQKYLCEGLYVGYILESLGVASEGKKYDARYWLYYLSSKGEIRTSPTAEDEGSSDNVLIENAATPQQEQIQTASEEKLLQSLQFQVQEILTTTCEISSQTGPEIPEKLLEDLEKSTPLKTTANVAQEKPVVDVQRSFEEAEREAQIARLEVSETPVAIFEQPIEDEVRDSLSRDISNYGNKETEEESVKTLKINEEEAEQGDDVESLSLSATLP
ncbi:unnamed protein product [Cuscuta campestris]|uniref:DUF4219 domain-containing protein n=1 Tax=Cuscuta campestris TaxID=132261 RepID=A0A484MS71_9ASTE|nr:unnamed protein product [Cuscuta campestris]